MSPRHVRFGLEEVQRSVTSFDLEIRHSSTGVAQDYRALDELVRRCKRFEATTDIATYDPSAVERAREFWRVRMVAEHQSASVLPPR